MLGMSRITKLRPRRQKAAHGPYWVGLVLGIAMLILGGGFYAVQLNRLPHEHSLMQTAADGLIHAPGLLGLTVSDIMVEGRETTDRETILAALAAGLGTPILAVNPTRAKEQLEALPWVHHAVVERRMPGTLYVRLVERKPLALWQHGGKIELIDRDGGVI